MATAQFEKLEDLIHGIEEGDYDKVNTALSAGKPNGHIKSSIINLKNGDRKTPLHIALEQPNPDDKIIELLLDSGTDVSYRYNGPFDKTKQRVQGDNYLHIAARAGNTNTFIYLFKKSVESNIHLLEYNKNHENPFHDAAGMGILPAVVKGMFEHLKPTEIKNLEGSIEKAKEAGSNEDIKKFQKELRVAQEKLKSDKSYINNTSYIVEALRSKCALNKDKKTPLDCIMRKEIKEEIKQTAGVQDKLICNKEFHIFLYIVGVVLSFIALCVTLYFLFLNSPTFALSSGVAMASGASACLLFKACEEIYNLHNEEASMQDVGITQVSEGVGVAAG